MCPENAYKSRDGRRRQTHHPGFQVLNTNSTTRLTLQAVKESKLASVLLFISASWLRNSTSNAIF